MATKPSHRLQIAFSASEIPNRPMDPKKEAWKILPAGQEQVFHFDSDVAFEQGAVTERPEYFEGHSPEQAQGRCFYSFLQPTPWGHPGMSLRVLWWEVQSAKVLWVGGAILNESMEAPLGRLRGQLTLTVGAQPDGSSPMWTEVMKNVTLSDENGCCFSLGEPIPWVHTQKLAWYVNRFKNLGVTAPDFFWAPQPCPDAQGGDAWQNQWTPFNVNMKNADGSWVTPKYWVASDPRNPPIGANIGESKVADWYLRQTHSHYREGGEGFRSPWETAFLASGYAGDAKQSEILNSLWEYTKAQVGGTSPTGQGYIDGRPNHLSLITGELFRAGQKYNLNEQDRQAPFTCILQEGRPQIGKTPFWENFGRSGLHPLEVTSSQFKGLYGLPNGSDYEHCATGPLLAATILYGDPLAQRQLHHICEEHVTKENVKFHSTRSDTGWKREDLANGYIAFQGSSEFGADAERYRNTAYSIAARSWDARFDQTPYQAYLTAGYEYMDQRDAEGNPIPERDKVGSEATMQLAIALHAACTWYQVEHNEARRTFWKAVIDYIALDCLGQPGLIDWSRGGIIQRYSLQTPQAVPGGPSASELVEQAAPPNYRSRNVLSAEGWVGPAMAEAWQVTGNDRMYQMAREIYDNQALVTVGHGKKQFNPQMWETWGTFYSSIRAFGFTS